MTTRRALMTTALLAALTACAGAPAPSAAPSPAPAVEGTYRFSGYTHSAGVVHGAIRFDSAGTAMLTSGGVTCASASRERDGRISLGCGRVAISIAREDDALAPQASLSIAVTETRDVPADPFECRGGDRGRLMGGPACVAYGMKRTIRTRWHTVRASLSRVE